MFLFLYKCLTAENCLFVCHTVVLYRWPIRSHVNDIVSDDEEFWTHMYASDRSPALANDARLRSRHFLVYDVCTLHAAYSCKR